MIEEIELGWPEYKSITAQYVLNFVWRIYLAIGFSVQKTKNAERALMPFLYVVSYLHIAILCGIRNAQRWFKWWLVAIWHQAITWTNADLSSDRSFGIHFRYIPSRTIKISIPKVYLKISPQDIIATFTRCHEIKALSLAFCAENPWQIFLVNGFSPYSHKNQNLENPLRKF